MARTTVTLSARMRTTEEDSVAVVVGTRTEGRLRVGSRLWRRQARCRDGPTSETANSSQWPVQSRRQVGQTDLPAVQAVETDRWLVRIRAGKSIHCSP